MLLCWLPTRACRVPISRPHLREVGTTDRVGRTFLSDVLIFYELSQKWVPIFRVFCERWEPQTIGNARVGLP
jgi:hypothetical protein